MVLGLHRQFVELAGHAQEALLIFLQLSPRAGKLPFNCFPHIGGNQVVDVHAAAPLQPHRLGQQLKFAVFIADQRHIKGSPAEVVDQQGLSVLNVPLRAVAHGGRCRLIHQLQLEQPGSVSGGAQLVPALFPVGGGIGQKCLLHQFAAHLLRSGFHVPEQLGVELLRSKAVIPQQNGDILA